MLGGLNNLYRMSLLLTADVRGFASGITRAETRLQKFAGRATAFGRSTARGLGLAFAYIGGAAVKAAADFDRANAILEKIVGQAGIDSLTQQAKELGRSSVFMATEISKAQLEIAKLGVQGEALEKVLVKAKNVATVFGTEIDATGKTILGTLRQFGLAVEDTTDGVDNVAFVSDVLGSAFKNSALDLASFKEGMKNVGPTARATGLDLVQTTSLLAVLANNAVQGSLGGTKLRSTLSDLAKQFPDVAVALERLENGTLSYAELVELLNKRAALVGAIFQDNAAEIRDFEAILGNANGTVDAMAEGLEDRLFFQVERTKNAFQSLGISIGEGVAPIMTDLADTVEKLAIAFDDMDPKEIEEGGRAIVFFLKAAAGSYVLGKMFTGIGLLRGAFQNLNKFVAVGGGYFVNFGFILSQLLRVLGPFVLIIGGATKAVEYLFSEDRILKYNAHLRKQKEEYDKLTESVERLRRQEDLRLRDERRIPSQGRKQLEDFLKIDPVTDAAGLNKLLEELDFFQTLAAQKAGEIAKIGEKIAFGIKNGFDVESLQVEQRALLKSAKDTDTYIDAIQRYLDFIKKESTAEGLNASDLGGDDDGTVAGRLLGVQLRFGELAVADRTFKDLDKVLKVQQGILGLPKAGELGIAVFDEDKTEAQAISIGMAADAISELAEANLKYAASQKTLKQSSRNDVGIERAIDAAVDSSKLKEYRAATQQLTGFLQQQLDFLGQAFLQASQNGEDFMEALKKSFLDTFNAIVAKLIVLVALYAALAALSQGTGELGNLANLARGENFREFLANGLGLPQGIIGGGTNAENIVNGPTDKNLAVEGAVSGNNIVIMSKRGTHAYDRTFG